MSQKILLCTTDDIANAFKTSVTENTNQLEFVKHNVPVFHNLIQVLKHTRPDIVYIMFNQVRFDSNNKQEINNQILQTIYNIKSDTTLSGTLSGLRIAVQVAPTIDQYFLRQLIMLNVYDIFEPSGNTGQLNIRKVIEQLTQPINIGNVNKYLLSPDINQSFQSPDVLPVRDTISNPNGGSSTATKTSPDDNALVNENRFLKGELARLNNKISVPSVPRTDYDDLLARLRELINNGPGDEKQKEAVESVISNNYSLSEDNEALNDRLKESTKLISQLEGKISTLKSKLKEDGPGTDNSKVPGTSAPKTSQDNARPDGNQARRRNSIKSQPRVAKTQRSKNRDGEPVSKLHGTKKRKWLILIVAFLIILLVWTGLGHLKSDSKKTVKQQPSYSQLIKEEKYAQAAQAYPDKGVAIENKMLNDGNIKNKASQAKKIAVFASGDAIDFDNYYFNGQFKKAVKLYENSNETSLTHLTDARRTMLAYSYMKTGNVDEARKLAQPLNNDQLNQKIEAYAKFQDANKTLQDKIDNGNLSDEDKANAQKQIEENRTAMKNL